MEKNVQHIDLDEIKKAREALNKELGIEPEKKVVTKPRVKELKLADDNNSKQSSENKIKEKNDDESNKDFSVYDNFAPFEVNKPVVLEEKKNTEQKPQESENAEKLNELENKEEKEYKKAENAKVENDQDKPKSLDEFLAGFNSLDDLMNMDLDSLDLGDDSSNADNEKKQTEEKQPVQENSPSLEEKVDKLKENYSKESNSMPQKPLDENLSKNLLDDMSVENKKQGNQHEQEKQELKQNEMVESNGFISKKEKSSTIEKQNDKTSSDDLHKDNKSINKISQNSQNYNENNSEKDIQKNSYSEPQKIEEISKQRESNESRTVATNKEPKQSNNNSTQQNVIDAQKPIEKDNNGSIQIEKSAVNEPKPIKKVENNERKPLDNDKKETYTENNINTRKAQQGEPQKFGQEIIKKENAPVQNHVQKNESVSNINKTDINPSVNNQITKANVNVSSNLEEQKKEKNLLPTIEDFKFIDIIKSNSFMESDELTCIYGMDEKKNIICQNFKDFYNVGIFTENDDEVFKLFSSIILSLTLKNSSYAIKYAICDAKNGSKFDAYNDLSHLFFNRIAKTNGEIIDTLTEISKEIEKRYEYLAKIGAKNIESFNEVMKKENIAPMPYIILFFNNYTRAVLLDDSDKIDTNLFNILKFGRLVGIYVNLVVFDEKLDDKINFNLQTRISFKAEDKTSSINRIGESGAEKIASSDEYVLKTLSNDGFTHLKVPNISQKEVELLIKNIEK